MSDGIRASRIGASLSDPDVGIVYDLEPESERLVIAWGGLAGRLGMAPFEFFRVLEGIDVKAVFVRDHAQAWYHRGVRGIGPGVDAVADHIRGLRAQAPDVAMIGTSAGGYAALLFGALVGCEAHAFVPQTFIDPDLRKTHRDRRWEQQLAALGSDLDPRYADLLPAMSASAAPAHLYYGEANRPDRIHAERVGDLEHVSLHPLAAQRHNVVRDLRESGWLKRFLEGLARGDR